MSAHPKILTRNLIAALLLTQLIACGGGSDAPDTTSEPEVPVEPVNIGGDGDIFEPTRLLNIAITLDPTQYNTLRQEGQSLAETARQCVPAFEYTDFAGTVTIDGSTMHNVSVRKKGFLGSLSNVRPSFKFDFDQFQDGRTYQNESRMTLNNNRQDASLVRQCLAYDLFREAGLPAPRCNFARVSVNGQDLGIYTNVEDIKKPFLKRVFGDSKGNLYEAQLADFGTHLSDRFEKKTNEDENDRSDLAAVAAAMELPDEQFGPAISALIDIDEFIRFWAMETLTGTWDSATGNANNFHIYRSPVDELFHFIPWGADTAFSGEHFFEPDSGPLYRNFRLADRLYGIEAFRAQYVAELNELLTTLWNEEELEERIEVMQTLTGVSDSALTSLRTFIHGNDSKRSQRALLVSAIEGLEPEQDVVLLADTEPDCTLPFSTNLSLSISSQNNVNAGTFQFTLPDGATVQGWADLSSAGVDSVTTSLDPTMYPATRTLIMSGVDLNNAFKPYAVVLLIEEPNYRVGTTSFHAFANTILLYEVLNANTEQESINLIAVGNRGTITISQRGVADDDVAVQISGSLEFLPEE